MLTAVLSNPLAFPPVWDAKQAHLILGPNDSDIQRGGREDTGDNEARPTEKGSGSAQPTVDPTAFGGTTSIRHPSTDTFNAEEERADLDGMEIMQADDGRLGLTDVGNKPADDWAADTGGPNAPEGHE
ncbi:MAG: hypothetical protein JO061_12500 [Acidobacteriaceae bacterium]|nr:hypothetical protein [Acidobacteriaceae bacterium]